MKTRCRLDFTAGNARFVRSVWEQAYGRMAVRAAMDGVIELAELTELTPDDLPDELPAAGRGSRPIGFQ